MRLHQRLRRDQGRHTDDWLITYADTITLLLCLFVVILSIRTHATSVAPPEPPSVQPDIFGGHPPFPVLPPAVTADETPVVPPLPPVQEPPRLAAADEATGIESAQPVRPPEPARAAEDRDGDRITTLEMNSAAFFPSGQAVLSGPGKVILRNVAVTLKSGAYDGYRIAVEGHTDDSPINTPQFQSNWELSTARAAAVVRFLLEQGIPAARLTAAGYADTFPVAPNRTADGTVIPDNQARNRRVVIRLERIEKAKS